MTPKYTDPVSKVESVKDNELMRILKVEEIRHFIVATNKGELNRVIRKGEDKYHYTLDSVPLEKDKEAEVIKLLK